MFRRTMLATAVVLTLSVAALGARFTQVFDPIEINVQALQDQLPDKLDKSQKKAAKAYKSALKKLGKDTVDLSKELKLGKFLAGKLSKLEDPQLEGLFLNASDMLQGEVLMKLDAIQQRLDAVGAKATPAKVQKQLDAAYAQMEAAASEVSVKKRFARYGKAEARSRKATKLLDKLGGGGGGGGLDCTRRAPGPGETGTVTFEGVEYQANELVVTVVRDPGPGISEFTVVVAFCETASQTYKAMRLIVEGEPNPGEYFANLMGGGASVTELLPPGQGGFSTFGTVTIESRENGSISGSFVTRQDIDPPILATFTVDDPDAN